jgi:2-amino-4-hydroxy-6-hydroxymethyldihydropteridine diphosphokinase
MGDRQPTPVAIALGSNLGDREAHLTRALAALGTSIEHLRASAFIDNAPVGVTEPQPRYLNAVAVGDTRLSAREVLNHLLAIERAHGRVRFHPNAARTLDLDLILYGREIIDEPGLIVPHPRFRDRPFVLRPLADLVPDWIDPVSGATIAALVERLHG